MEITHLSAGSGKTAAFLLPILSQIYTEGPGETTNSAKASRQVREKPVVQMMGSSLHGHPK